MRPESAAGLGPAAARRRQIDAIGPGFGGLVRRTLLLNFGIFLSVVVMGMLGGEPTALGVVLVVTTAILWCATFAIAPFFWLGQVFWRRHVLRQKPPPPSTSGAGGIRDQWLDGM